MSYMRDRRREARLRREQEAADAMKPRWHKPTPIAWACVIAAVLTLFGLSIWQVERLQWKEGLIADIQANRFSRAYPVLPEDVSEIREDMAFARVKLTGEFLHDDEIHLAARYYNSQLGYHILTPFRLSDKRVVLVNRGWVSTDNKNPQTRPKGQLTGEQHIIGMVRLDNDKNMFTPEHDVKENIWFWRDIDSIEQATGYALVPVNIDLLYDAPPGSLPIPSDGLVRLRNDHLGYAITWLLIGVSALVIFVLYHYHPPKQEQQDEADMATTGQGHE